MCEPRSGLLGRFRRGVLKSRFLAREAPEPTILSFSDDATALMAEGSRATFAVFASAFEELRELECPGLVKLACETDSGGVEHMWFEVHSVGESGVDATLTNQPFDIAGMSPGDRAVHPVDRLTEWAILTPAGPVNARSQGPLRWLRENRDEVLRQLRAPGPLDG